MFRARYHQIRNFSVCFLLCGSTTFYFMKTKTNTTKNDRSINHFNYSSFNYLNSSLATFQRDIRKTIFDIRKENPKAKQIIYPFPNFEASNDAIFSDLNRTLYWLDLWNYDTNCTRFGVHLLREGSQEPGALVSFPGSGNSWLRMLLEGLTGIYINSVYSNGDNTFRSKANSRFKVNADCKCTLLQKTHDFSLDTILDYLPVANRTQTLDHYKRKGIFIIRNPFSAIYSYRNFNFGGLKGTATDSAFKGSSWDGFVNRSIVGWETLATVWIRGLQKGGVVYYERLRHNIRSELIRLVKMMGITYDEDRLNCVLKHSEDNSFKRKLHNKRGLFTDSQREFIYKAIERVQEVLRERGFDPLPIDSYKT